MDSTTRACPSCDTPVPAGAKFCSECGAATPTEDEQPAGSAPARDDADEAAFRTRLQEALGANYELGALVGSGGFAEVYAARDLRLKRDVAVKVLRSELMPSLTALVRFQREAEAIAQLRHPNIVPIYDIGEGEDLAYFVMPLVKGESLATALHRQPRLSVEETQRILRDAASALHEGHEAGLVHRDIKPENIMLEGKQRRVLVMDFGIAKAVGADAEGGGLTMTGAMIGTPLYMSPEQASGQPDIDHRTDQYALAVTGYRMLTGRLPFEARTPQEAIYKTAVESPTPVDELRPDVPAFLCEAVERALAKRADDRYANIEEFAAAVSGGVPVDAVEAHADEEQAAADSGEPAMSRRVAALAAIGLLAFVGLYRLAFPPEVGAPEITRAEALSIARDFLAQAGGIRFQEAVWTHSAGDRFARRRFLELTLGMAGARRRVMEEPLIGDWHVRWFQPLEIEGWAVTVGSNGTIIGFTHTVDDAAPGARLDEARARAVADSFLVARGWDLAELEASPSSVQNQPNRTDHAFNWTRPTSTIPWNEDDPAAGTGSVLVHVRVQGDRIGRYSHFLQVPGDFERHLRGGGGESMRGILSPILLTLPFVIAVALLVIGTGSGRGRARSIGWRAAFTIGALYLAAILVDRVNAWPLRKIDYWSGQSLPGFFFNDVLGFLASLGLYTTFATLVVAAAAEFLARQSLPATLAGYRDALRGRWLTPAVVRAGVTGCTLGLVITGYNAVFWTVARSLPGVARYDCLRNLCTDMSTLQAGPDNWHHYYPDHYAPFLSGFIDAAHWGVLMALPVLFFLAAFHRTLKSRAAAAVLTAALLGLIGPWVYPTYLGSVGSGLTMLILALIVLRYGLLTCMVAVYFSESLFTATTMVGSGESGLVANGIVLLACALLPASLVLIARRRGLPVPALVGPSG